MLSRRISISTIGSNEFTVRMLLPQIFVVTLIVHAARSFRQRPFPRVPPEPPADKGRTCSEVVGAHRKWPSRKKSRVRNISEIPGRRLERLTCGL